MAKSIMRRQKGTVGRRGVFSRGVNWNAFSVGALSASTCHFFRKLPTNSPWLIIHVAAEPFKIPKCQVDVTKAIEGISVAILPFHTKELCATDAHSLVLED